MQKAKLTMEAMRTVRATRGTTLHSKAVKAMFATAKGHYSIAPKERLKAEIDDRTNPNFGVLIRKKTRQPYMRQDSLVPDYGDYTVRFIKLSNAAAVKEVAKIAKLRGFATVAAPTLGWANSAPNEAGTHLTVKLPTGNVSVPMVDVLSALRSIGKPVMIDQDPLGYGGVTIIGKDVFVPA